MIQLLNRFLQFFYHKLRRCQLFYS